MPNRNPPLTFAAVLFMTVGIALFLLGLLAVGPNGTGVMLMVAGGLAVLVGVFLLVKALQQNKVAASADRVGGYALAPEERTVGGERYQVFFRKAGHKNNPPAALFVQVPVTAPTNIDFTREGWFDRLGKSLGIAAEVQTGDAEFDEAVYVRADSDAFAEAYLAEPARRAAVLALKAAGFTTIRLTREVAQAEWVNFDPAKQDRPELADAAAAAVLVLAAGVPATEPDPDRPAGNRRGRQWALGILAMVWAFLLGFVFAYPPVRNAELLLPGFTLGAFAYLLFAAGTGVLLRGTSTSHDLWGTLVCFGLVLIPMGSVGAIAAANGPVDDAPRVVKQGTVVGKRVAKGKGNSRTYYLSVTDWAGGEPLEFRVSQGEHDVAVARKSRLDVTVGPGALGIEWVAGKQFVP